MNNWRYICVCCLLWKAQQVIIGTLPDNGDITFNYKNKRKILSLLNFPRAAILDFMILFDRDKQ